MPWSECGRPHRKDKLGLFVRVVGPEAAGSLPEMICDFLFENPHHPGSFGRLAGERFFGAERCEEGLLHHLLGDGLIAHTNYRKAK